jgi:hypothetical protein
MIGAPSCRQRPVEIAVPFACVGLARRTGTSPVLMAARAVSGSNGSSHSRPAVEQREYFPCAAEHKPVADIPQMWGPGDQENEKDYVDLRLRVGGRSRGWHGEDGFGAIRPNDERQLHGRWPRPLWRKRPDFRLAPAVQFVSLAPPSLLAPSWILTKRPCRTTCGLARLFKKEKKKVGDAVRSLLSGALLAGTILLDVSAASAQDRTYPFCATISGIGHECVFDNLAQCQQTTEGEGGWCDPNPAAGGPRGQSSTFLERGPEPQPPNR